MNFLRKIWYRLAVMEAEALGCMMQKISLKRYKIVDKLFHDWSLENYQQLEEVRCLAQSEGHWFEESMILLDEVWCLLKYNKDQELFCKANRRMEELQEVCDMPDNDFVEKCRSIYWKDERQVRYTELFFMDVYQYYSQQSDNMTSMLNYNASILCGKMKRKIALLIDKISLEERMETLFKLGKDYGSIREPNKAMYYYDEALKEAQNANSKTYEYVSFMLKLSICQIYAHIQPHVNLESERVSAISGLFNLCDGEYPHPYRMGEELLQKEMERYVSASKKEKKRIQLRIFRLREAKPVLDQLIALSYGDWQTANRSATEIAQSKAENYGYNYSNANAMELMYKMAYHSPSRNEVETGQDEVEEEADVPVEVNFPPEMHVADQYNQLMMYIRNEVELQHLFSAVGLGNQAVKIAQSVHSDYYVAMAVHSIGQAFEKSGYTEEALKYYGVVVQMLKEPEYLGSDVSLSLYLLYVTLFEMGNLLKQSAPQKAVEFFDEVLSVLEKTATDRNLFEVYTLIGRAIAYGCLGREREKESDCIQALDILMQEAKSRLPYMESDLRENYWMEQTCMIDRMLDMVDKDSSPLFRKKVYEAVLFAKGFLLSSENAVRKAIYSEEELAPYRSLYEELEEYMRKKNPWGTLTEDSSDRYMEYYMKTMRLQLAINGVVGKYYDFVNIDYASIAQSLKKKEVVIDYYDYPLDDDDRQYVAFVYRKGDEAPFFQKVCKESDLKRLYSEVSACKDENGKAFHISELYNPAYSFGASLVDITFSPIAGNFGVEADEQVYFVASGSLHKVALESLVVLSRISHARTLTERGEADFENIELFGGLDYGENDNLAADSRGYMINTNEAEPTVLAPWKELQYSLDEVNKIAFMWKRIKGEKITPHTGHDGSVADFYRLHGKNTSILHLATHGFFETVKSARNLPALRDAYKPMDLTGLVMSGGNIGWLHGDNRNREGILTASDIAMMDLSATSLVVLSACYTGEGEVRSDGVFGLQRAFKKAGADTIVMSLWHESDRVAAEFMSIFYNYLLFHKTDKKSAFIQAKAAIRKHYPHPMFWANFIMID